MFLKKTSSILNFSESKYPQFKYEELQDARMNKGVKLFFLHVRDIAQKPVYFWKQTIVVTGINKRKNKQQNRQTVNNTRMLLTFK